LKAQQRLAPLAALCLIVCAHSARAQDDEPTVTPYRPTVSNPADLSAPGWLELEAGASWLRDADATRTVSAPYLLKYAFDEDHGVLLGGTAWLDQMPRDGSSASGFGDTFIEWKQRFALREGMAFGIEAGVEVPTARANLGNGKPAYLINGIFSTDLGATHLDVNAGGTRFTRTQAPGAAWQNAWAVALSHPLGAQFGVAAEISGTAQRAVEHSHQALTALNYNLSRRCVLDAGVAYGLDRADHTRNVFFGGTFLIGKLR
jgi:hypothetical protein